MVTCLDATRYRQGGRAPLGIAAIAPSSRDAGVVALMLVAPRWGASPWLRSRRVLQPDVLGSRWWPTWAANLSSRRSAWPRWAAAGHVGQDPWRGRALHLRDPVLRDGIGLVPVFMDVRIAEVWPPWSAAGQSACGAQGLCHAAGLARFARPIARGTLVGSCWHPAGGGATIASIAPTWSRSGSPGTAIARPGRDRGVAGPEASNNAAATLVHPLLTSGFPPTSSWHDAGALTLHGIRPGRC